MLYTIDYPHGGKTDSFIEWGRYGNGSTAFRLVDTFGEVMSVPTVNLEEHGMTPPDGEVFIKAYSEGEGMTEALQEAGILEHVETILVGPYQSPVHRCRLLVSPTPPAQ